MTKNLEAVPKKGRPGGGSPTDLVIVSSQTYLSRFWKKMDLMAEKHHMTDDTKSDKEMQKWGKKIEKSRLTQYRYKVTTR